MKTYDGNIVSETVIVADGAFPEHEIPLNYIRRATRIICCDGSAGNLISVGYIPEAIVGDMDSLSDELAERFRDRSFRVVNQENNDLTKAVNWCAERGYNDIVIVGATGKREDHTLGNISLLAEYIKSVNIFMVTDSGILIPFMKSCKVSSSKGQQISIFSINPETIASSTGLKYPLMRTRLRNWWVATLNEATGDHFEVDFKGGPIILFLKFRD
jgi:thiamine pyrophosphokinase